MTDLSAQLDALLVGVKTMKIRSPINHKYFHGLVTEHESSSPVGPKHGDASIQPIYPGIARRPLFLESYKYTIEKYGAAHGLNTKKQGSLFGLFEGIERNIHMIEAEEQSTEVENVAFLYLTADATGTLLQCLDIMISGTDNGLNNYDKNMLRGAARHFYFALETKISQYDNVEQEEEEEETENINSDH